MFDHTVGGLDETTMEVDHVPLSVAYSGSLDGVVLPVLSGHGDRLEIEFDLGVFGSAPVQVRPIAKHHAAIVTLELVHA
jgi:hypothetical protein